MGGRGGRSRSSGTGGGTASSASSNEASNLRGPGGELDTAENIAKMESKVGKEADAFLSAISDVKGIDRYLPDMINKPATSTDSPNSGISSRIIRLAEFARGGGTYGSKKNTDTTITPSGFAESLQTISNPSVQSPTAETGRYVASKAYERLSNAGKQKLAYEITKGFYRMNSDYVNTLPKGMRDDLAARINRVQSGVDRVNQARGRRWGF